MMRILISNDLPHIPAEEVEFMAKWIAKDQGAICFEASLVSVLGRPQDADKKATSRAAISMMFKGDPKQKRYLCYIYANGDNEARHSGNGPYLCRLYKLQPLQRSR
ncbi:hypothetical protein ACFLY0_01020 [Patescibacteria group bacterium]